MPPSPFAVLWDLDGILVDTGSFHLQAWSQVLTAAGWPFSPELFRRTFGMNNYGVLSAGMHCLAVTNTNPASALATADRVVDSLEDLPPDAFEQLLASPATG
jgi:beta-phosphoglucomutase-like phosphatase (HAD superfamily)